MALCVRPRGECSICPSNLLIVPAGFRGGCQGWLCTAPVRCDCPTNGRRAESHGESLITSTEDKPVMALTACRAESSAPVAGTPRVGGQLAVVPPPSPSPPPQGDGGSRTMGTVWCLVEKLPVRYSRAGPAAPEALAPPEFR